MGQVLDRRHDRAFFANRAIVLANLDQSTSRGLTARVNEAVGQSDAMPRTQAEYDGPFDAVAGGRARPCRCSGVAESRRPGQAQAGWDCGTRRSARTDDQRSSCPRPGILRRSSH